MRYKVITADSATELETKVTACLRDGWQLCGGVSVSLAVEHEAVSRLARNDRHALDTVIHERFAQALITPEFQPTVTAKIENGVLITTSEWVTK